MTYPQVTESWAVATAENDGTPLVLRINRGAAPLARHPAFGVQVGIAVPLNAPDANGLPTAAEAEALGALEDALVGALHADRLAQLVVVITAPGRRELVFYTRDSAAVPPRVRAVAERLRTHEVRLMQRDDPAWEVYRALGGDVDVDDTRTH